MKAAMRLSAVPKLISLDDTEIQNAVKECRQQLSNSSIVETLGGGRTTLRHVQSPAGGMYFLFNENSREILYLVRYRNVELSGFPTAARQVLVWRNSTDADSTGIAQHVFWKYLFKKYRVLVSDSQQSEKGRAFWQYQVAYALNHGHRVQLVNSNDKTSVEIHSLEELGNLQSDVWDPRDWFTRILLVIS